MNLTNQFIKGILSGFGALFLINLSNLFIIPLVIYYLGTENYGFYVFLFACADVVWLLDMGLSKGLLQKLSSTLTKQEIDQHTEQLKIGHTLFAVILLAVLILAVPVSHFLPDVIHLTAHQRVDAFPVLLAVLLDAGINLYGNYYNIIVQSHCKNDVINFLSLGRTLGANISTLILVAMGYSLLVVFIARLLFTVLFVVLMAKKAAELSPGQKLQMGFYYNKSAFLDLTHITMFTMLSTMAFVLSRYSNNFILASLLSMTFVGIYGLSNRLTNFILMIQFKIIETAYPILSHSYHQGNVPQTRNYVVYLSALLIYIALVMSGVFYLNLASIIHFLGSGKISYIVALPVTLALLVQSCSLAAQSIPSHFLLVSGQHKPISYINFATALVSIGLSYWMTAQFGFNGLILGLLFPQVLIQLFVIIPMGCKHAELPVATFVSEVFRMVILPVSGAFVLTFGLLHYLPEGTDKVWVMARLVLSCLMMAALSMGIWFVATSSDQKTWLYDSLWIPVSRRFKRMLPSA